MRAMQELAEERPVFFKDTLDYRYPDVLVDLDFQRAVTHSFMIRPPEAVVAPYLRIYARARAGRDGFREPRRAV